jgi:hypothetical protein
VCDGVHTLSAKQAIIRLAYPNAGAIAPLVGPRPMHEVIGDPQHDAAAPEHLPNASADAALSIAMAGHGRRNPI